MSAVMMRSDCSPFLPDDDRKPEAIIQDIDYMLDEMSVGNFCINTREEARYVGEYGRILDSIRRINRTLSHTLRQIDGAAIMSFLGQSRHL